MVWLLGAGLSCAPMVAQDSVRGRTANPHGALNIQCENCHTSTAWKPIRRQLEFDHDRQTSFPLQGLHKPVACQSCHGTLVFSTAPTRCSECHADLHRRQFGPDCESCHTVRGWKVSISSIQQHSNRFPLIGAHAAATCDDCHHGAAAGVYTGLSTQCVSCHLPDYQQAAPLNHVVAKLPTTCETCHGMNVWTGARFDHAQFTTFALTGLHATVACAQCHVGASFAGTSTQCVGCHMADYNRATNPNHKTDNFSTTCEGCHNTSGWQNATFDHNLSRFALTGAHTSVQCAQCHANGVFTATPFQCVGCHLADFQKTTSPNHQTSGFPQDCATCHTTTAWTGATFNHATTGFPLVGLHASQQCLTCHVNNNYSLTSTACIGCHLNDFNGANNPPHQAGGFPQDCTLCHGTSALAWTGATFDHATTGFTLTGAHNSIQCAQCHVSNNFSLTGTACWGCHQTDFNKTDSPPHKSGNFPQDCSGCHTTTDWNGATFNHATTGFALVGLHGTQQCTACHVSNNYNLTSAACWGCHQTDFNGANNPPHLAAGFPQDCSVCHGSSALAWTGAAFDHASTGFTLTGSHNSIQCAQCHVSNNYTLTSGACWGCHQTDYNNTTNPSHKATNFPQDCSGCHTTTNWNGATFNHTSTGFALVGLHASQQCATCHVNNNYSLSNAACINCHSTDFNGANNPPHKAAGFPQDCAVCHGSSALNWTGAVFDHATTGFTLTGTHTSTQCLQCHVSGNYSLTSGACWNCHQTDYNNTANPSHKATNFPQDCSGCHTTVNWNGAVFNHASTGFALVGLHASQQCNACHLSNNYSLNSATCINCHLTDFNNTTNPPHKVAGFPQDCTLCHGSSALNWSTANFNHATTGFALVGLHATQQCVSCHVGNNYNLTTVACWNCHQTDYNGATNPAHKAAGFPQDCTPCHGATALNWTSATFNHSTTGFALTGAHTTSQCAQCHVSNNYSLTAANALCYSCHQADYNGTTNPAHKAANFPQDCSGCHTTANWNGATFNHTSTGFALVGVHGSQQCTACHLNGNYSLNTASTACYNCHQADYNGANNPPHKAGGFPQDCVPCHGSTAVNWTGATFNHATTGFTLTGTHTTTQCAACHVSNNYSLTAANALCYSCHQTDYNGTTNPAHKAANFPQDCSGCHTTVNWNGATFNHTSTGFALVGVHGSQQCTACHLNGNYSLNTASTACYNCHQADYNGANNPPHKAGGFPQDCVPCHGSTAVNWTSATFNHATTGFTLTGTHTTTQCAACHVSNNYSLTAANALCYSCHQTDYNGTTNPAHKAANFPQDCSGCHTTVNWNGATFNHASTGFTLVGLHATQQCVGCHVNGNYSLTSGACWNCHQTDYNGATNPAHKAGGFPQDCVPCHGAAAVNWTSATFNHSTTGFALTGTHTTTQCVACHVSSNYSLTAANALCYSCHQTDYNGTTNPAHRAANFPQDCSGCHTTVNWNGATFNHTSTGFALVGLHNSQQCTACHGTGNYTLNAASTTCWNCHQADYNGANNPVHSAAGFPQDCTQCHGSTILNWTSATFNHTTLGFALTGTHNTIQCAACHTNGNYGLTAANTLCYSCHQTDYNGTNNPAHKAANFPQDCSGCHTTVNWSGATFNHTSTGFALVGVHNSQQCTACHGTSNYSLNAASTTCWNCHQADYNGANNPAHLAAGFPQDCTQCHGSTILNWTSATFNHSNTGFALTGTHSTTQCAACHVSNNYALTAASALCYNCHKADYNGTTNPAHQAANFPQDCSGCHTTVNWSGATFNHASTGFALVGLHASQLCTACHVNNNYSLNTASTACWNCHQAVYNTAMSPPHLAGAFPQDCTLCHGATAVDWTSATFNHSNTGFALVGLHATQLCAACHVNNNYSLTTANTLCYSCHQANYAGTANPPHAAANFSQVCTTCHPSTILDWTGATFSHATTGFTLVGLHATQLCTACHVNNNYSLTSAACWNCHQAVYNTAMSPPHLASGFPQDCTQCHGSTAVDWTSATFNHTATGFTLTGTHLTIQCVQCHVSNNYSLTAASALCWNCHQANYNGTTNPPHLASGFPQDCSGCHTTTDWTGATFNHTTTGFALTGTHLTILCTACHVSNNFSLTAASAACWNCHQTDYNGTTAPAHAAAGFPQDCSVCHSTTNWSGATFTHPTTPLTLSGFHATMLTNNQCTSCHVGNSYTNTPSDCYSCHKTDYANTTNPGHAAAGFAQTCSTCHTFVDWTGATYTAHDAAYFPIYSGTHKGKWTTCADCHSNTANYAVFSCIICHQHSNQTTVTNQHNGSKNFVYNGTSCYTCHPKGNAG